MTRLLVSSNGGVTYFELTLLSILAINSGQNTFRLGIPTLIPADQEMEIEV
jgi:hypothetical protein